MTVFEGWDGSVSSKQDSFKAMLLVAIVVIGLHAEELWNIIKPLFQ
jgi:hypothetical protein